MATASRVDENDYTSMFRDLCLLTNCKICNKPLSDPKILICGHIFCLLCLEKEFQKSNLKYISCPICGTTSNPKNGDLKNLPNVSFLNELRGLIDARHADEFCSVCKKANASAFCTDCDKQLCDNCSSFHESFYDKDSHTILQKSNVKDALVPMLASKKKIASCGIHQGKSIKYLCTTCNCLVCSECSLTKHVQCKKKTIENAALDTRHFMKELKTELRKQTDYRIAKEKALQKFTSINQSCTAGTENKIKRCTEGLINVLHQKEKELFNKVRDISEKNEKVAKHLKDDCDSQMVMEKSILQYIEDLEKHGSDIQLAEETSELKRRFEQLKRQQENIDIPKENDDFDFHPSWETFSKIKDSNLGEIKIQSNSNEGNYSDWENQNTYADCTDQEDPYNTAELRTYDLQQNLPPRPPLPDIPQLLHSASVPDLKQRIIMQHRGLKHRLSEQNLQVDEEPYKSFSDEDLKLEDHVSDTSPPAIHSFSTEEEKPIPENISTFHAQVEVSGFDISQTGEIFIVSNQSRSCLVFERQGKRKTKISVNLKNPWDVGIGQSQTLSGPDLIYVSDSGTGKAEGTVREFTYKGFHLRNIGGTKMKSPRGVSVSRTGDIYVCEAENRSILIISPHTGKTIKKIKQNSGGLALFQYPLCISISPKGQCYVTDKITKDITILSDSCEKIDSYTGRYRFGSRDDYVGYNLQFNPTMSCSDRRNNVYIIDMCNHCLHVLLSDGNVKEVEIKHEYYTPYPRSPPVALAFDSNQELWIATENGVVFRFPSSELQQILTEG